MMENGIDIVGDAKLEERNGCNDEESGSNVKENVDMSLDGSIITKEENSELIVRLGNDEEYPDEFHEAVATPSLITSEELVVKTEISMSKENHDDKEIIVEKFVRRETNGLMDEITVESNVNVVNVENDDYKELNDELESSKEQEYGIPVGFAEKGVDKNSIDTMEESQRDSKVGDDATSFNPENGTSLHEDLVDILEKESMKSESADILECHLNETLVEVEDQNIEKGSEATIKDASHEIDSVNPHRGIEEGRVGEEEEKLCISSSNLKDDETTETKMVDIQVETQRVDEKENISTSPSDDSSTDHGVETKLHSLIDNSNIVRVIAEVGPQSSSDESSAKATTSSQLNLPDSRAEIATKINEKPEVGGNNDENPVVSKPTIAAKSPSNGVGLNAVLETPSTSSTSATPAHPAGLGRAAPLPEPTSRVAQQPRANGGASTTQNSQLIDDPANGETEVYDETREKLQMIRVKFLRLARRLGQTPHNVVVAQVLYRLGLAEQLHGRSGGRSGNFTFDQASAMAEQLEAAGQEPLDFTCTIMVIGKSGVGKSATINSIFGEVFFKTDAFDSGTKKVQDIVGTVEGIRVRVIDTPGLLPSWSDQHKNERILNSVKKFMKKTPPDIVLYLDRLDMQSRDSGDMPLLKSITEAFGPSIWFNAIVVLTHAASAPPEGQNGAATSYDMFVTQRSHVVQQAIRQAAGDMRLMNPVSLVENHSACRINRAGQRVLPNGQVWKPHLLLLSFASKILAEANTLLKLQDTPQGRVNNPRARSPPLPFLLSSILQSRPEIKLPSEQFGEEDDIDDVIDEGSDSEEESEYDELPPFKPLTKAQLGKLSKEQRKAYYDEVEYRERLFMKKQMKEERERRKMIKKMEEEVNDYGENGEEESSSSAGSIPVPMPDLTLPASFDSDNPTHRYRSLDSNPWLIRAVLEPNGWDHDIGYDGVNVERLFAVKEKIPVSFSGHISKDKKEANLQMEVASTVKHGKGKTTSLGFDMQSVGKDYAYTLRSETKFINQRLNKAVAGLSATVLGDVLTGGFKLEDKLVIGKRGEVVVSGGGIYGRGEVAYGGSLQATLREKDNPLERFLSTFGLSIMDWHGDVAIGCNSQTQIPIGRWTNLIGRFNINNRGSGQFSIKVNSSEQMQMVLVGLIPVVKKIMSYYQQGQFGY